MPVTALSNRGTPILSTLALLVLAGSGLATGCKTSQPVASVPPAAPKRVPVTPVPAVKKHLYSADADPKTDIAAALTQARHEHKRVILDFGGDWCGDCQVLDIYFQQSPNADLLNANFLVVHIDIGHMDKNVDIARSYGVPLDQGVPALAVLDAHGKLLYSQASGEFESMRYMQVGSVTDFLNRWKA